MRDRYFNFLYIPSGNAQPRPLRVRRSTVLVVAGLVVAGIAAATVTAFRYAERIRQAHRLAVLETQNEQMRRQIGELTGELDELRRQVAQNFDFQKKARILANLDELSDDITEVGVGGPDVALVRSVSALDPETRERIISARTDIEKLLRQARLQTDSYREILTALETETEKLRTTPSLRPVNVGFVSSWYGWRVDPITGRKSLHRGMDFSARLGTPVFATADGVVTFSGRWKTYGEVIEITHGQGFVTRYAHLQKRLVRKGQKVRRGDIIGRVGSTGRSTFSHLHYEVEKDGRRVNPARYVLAR